MSSSVQASASALATDSQTAINNMKSTHTELKDLASALRNKLQDLNAHLKSFQSENSSFMNIDDDKLISEGNFMETKKKSDSKLPFTMPQNPFPVQDLSLPELAEKTIVFIGCNSITCYIAEILCKSGIGSIYFVDESKDNVSRAGKYFQGVYGSFGVVVKGMDVEILAKELSQMESINNIAAITLSSEGGVKSNFATETLNYVAELGNLPVIEVFFKEDGYTGGFTFLNLQEMQMKNESEVEGADIVTMPSTLATVCGMLVSNLTKLFSDVDSVAKEMVFDGWEGTFESIPFTIEEFAFLKGEVVADNEDMNVQEPNGPEIDRESEPNEDLSKIPSEAVEISSLAPAVPEGFQQTQDLEFTVPENENDFTTQPSQTVDLDSNATQDQNPFDDRAAETDTWGNSPVDGVIEPGPYENEADGEDPFAQGGDDVLDFSNDDDFENGGFGNQNQHQGEVQQEYDENEYLDETGQQFEEENDYNHHTYDPNQEQQYAQGEYAYDENQGQVAGEGEGQYQEYDQNQQGGEGQYNYEGYNYDSGAYQEQAEGQPPHQPQQNAFSNIDL